MNMLKDSNKGLWQEVISEVKGLLPNFPPLEQLKMVFEGSDGNGQEPQILGIFQIPDGKFLAVSFRYDGSWNDFTDVKIETKDQFDDLILWGLLPPDQRAEVRASI